MSPHALLAVLGGYLSGSVPFGVLLVRWVVGTDVREQGSGNIGATNVMRVAGKKLGAVVLVLDAAKGALPVVAAASLWPAEPRLHVAVGLAAFLGHVFPVWLKLKGGKGVATALGVWGVLMPGGAVVGAVVFVVVAWATRISAVGSLLGGGAAVVASFFLSCPAEYRLLGGLFFALMLFTHRSNLSRLWHREERKL